MTKQFEIVAEYNIEERDGKFFAEITGLITVDGKTEEKAILKLNNFYNFLVAGWRNRGKLEEHLIKNDFKKTVDGWRRVQNEEHPSLRIFFND